MRNLSLENSIFNTSLSFEERALEVFRFQFDHTRIYREFCTYLGVRKKAVTTLEAIPFLPIELFKNHTVLTDGLMPESTFRSSGTTGQVTSVHPVAVLEVYQKSIFNGFLQALGTPKDYCILGLLPAYLERQDASLVYMVNYLMEQSQHPGNGFFLNNYTALIERLQQLEKAGQQCLLVGVTFALLDLAEQFSFPLAHTTIVETGGMKGRRKEITRQELHQTLFTAFPGVKLSSEYGMTELLSQAYWKNDLFIPSSTMKVIPRELNDPFTYANYGKTAALNIVDLANLYSCSFIATQDIGKVYADGRFEVLGRMDNSDLRGCNLMVV